MRTRSTSVERWRLTSVSLPPPSASPLAAFASFLASIFLAIDCSLLACFFCCVLLGSSFLPSLVLPCADLRMSFLGALTTGAGVPSALRTGAAGLAASLRARLASRAALAAEALSLDLFFCGRG